MEWSLTELAGNNTQRFHRFTEPADINDWNITDFVSDKSLKALDVIVDQAFDEINDVLDKYDTNLTDLEQELTTALAQVRNLMTSYRAQDEMDERYVL